MRIIKILSEIEDQKLVSSARVVATRKLSSIPAGSTHKSQILSEIPAVLLYIRYGASPKEITLGFLMALTIVKQNISHIQTLALYRQPQKIN